MFLWALEEEITGYFHLMLIEFGKMHEGALLLGPEVRV